MHAYLQNAVHYSAHAQCVRIQIHRANLVEHGRDQTGESVRNHLSLLPTTNTNIVFEHITRHIPDATAARRAFANPPHARHHRRPPPAAGAHSAPPPTGPGTCAPCTCATAAP